MVWYGEYNGNKNEGDDNEQVDGDNNVVPAQLRGCVQWTARELPHHIVDDEDTLSWLPY